MRPLRYLPYEQASDVANVVVDGSATPATTLVLSHWPGLGSPTGLEHDLSAGMAFRYVDRCLAGSPEVHQPAEAVTNNHFDQDGLVGMFAFVDPQEAMRQRALLIDVAAAGDFATYRSRQAARVSMVIAAYADPERSPLGPAAFAGDYPSTCAALYDELLGRLAGLAGSMHDHRHLWAEEDAVLSASEAALADGRVTVEEHPELDLTVVTTVDDAPTAGGHRFAGMRADGLHPMAVCNAIQGFRIVQLRGRRYELTYRYESWVQYRSRRPLPRVGLAPIAEHLCAEELGGARWIADGVDVLTPRLRLEGDDESSLSPERFIELVCEHLRAGAPAWDPYGAA